MFGFETILLLFTYIFVALAAAKAPSPSSSLPHHSTPLLPGLPLGNSLDEDGLPMSRDPLATLTRKYLCPVLLLHWTRLCHCDVMTLFVYIILPSDCSAYQ